MLLSVRIYTHPRGDEMDEEGGALIRALSPITNKEQKSMTGSECRQGHSLSRNDKLCFIPLPRPPIRGSIIHRHSRSWGALA